MSPADRNRFAFTLALLATVTLAATLSGCTPSASARASLPVAPPIGRTVQQQHLAAVKITTMCMVGFQISGGTGTGEVIGDHSVLTAGHVVHCHEPGAIGFSTVDVGDGVELPAVVDMVVEGSDVARLMVKTSLAKWNSPVSIGPVPAFGDVACMSTAGPDLKTYRCGTVQDRVNMTADGDITMDGFFQFGNSGSALYNQHGQIIGVMVMLMKCQGGFQCVGFGSSLEHLPGLLP